MVAAAAAARAVGVRSMCGFNYRRVPAVALMRQLVAAGRLGEIRHVRAVYLQDWIVDPQFPLVWRLQRDKAGSGALGDIGAHIVDLTQFVTGQRDHRGQRADRDVRQGSGRCRRVQRAGRARPATAHGRRSPWTTRRCSWPGSSGGAVATYEATRFATGRKNGLRVEINGSLGSRRVRPGAPQRAGVLRRHRPAAEQGFTRILVTEPEHPYLSAWWPPGHIIGYEHSFTHQMRDLIEAVATGADPQPVVRRRRCRCSGCSTRWSAAPPATAPGPRPGALASVG